MTKNTISIKYTAASKEIEITNVQFDHLLDIFVSLKASTMTSLKFYDTSITPDEVNLITPLIPHKLDLLDLSNINISSKVLSILTKKLNCCRIQCIDLSFNPIGDSAIWSLLDAIGKNQYLTSLKIAHCDLTENGIWPLLNILTSREFGLLDISENVVHSLGSDYILQFLKSGPKLREFHADRCQISEGDIGPLIDAAEQCNHMEVFSILGNGIIQFRKISPKIQVDMLREMK